MPRDMQTDGGLVQLSFTEGGHKVRLKVHGERLVVIEITAAQAKALGDMLVAYSVIVGSSPLMGIK